jgi:hypothetical protein
VSQFLYFIPGQARIHIPRADVQRTFAATALREQLRSDRTWTADAVTFNPLMHDGPGGSQGTIFACLPGGMAIDGFDVDYKPDRQTWLQAEGGWLGWYTDNPPTEASLRRERLIEGYGVRLNDDCEWTAPVIRGFTQARKVRLPVTVGRDGSGMRTMTVKTEYERFPVIAEKLWDLQFSRVSMTVGECLDAAAILLSLNYQIGPVEADALGLFEMTDTLQQSANWWGILHASYDWPLITEALGTAEADELKKKEESEPGHSALPAGSGDAVPLAEVSAN